MTKLPVFQRASKKMIAGASSSTEAAQALPVSRSNQESKAPRRRLQRARSIF
jgi:hypothetical protein